MKALLRSYLSKSHPKLIYLLLHSTGVRIVLYDVRGKQRAIQELFTISDPLVTTGIAASTMGISVII